MDFDTKIAIVVAEDLETWRKLNVVSFLTSGIVGRHPEIIGEPYTDATEKHYWPLCIQPVVILKAPRVRLNTFLARTESRGIEAAVYIEDMFATGHDGANRETVRQYATDQLPLVGLGVRADKKIVDKVFKGAKLHD